MGLKLLLSALGGVGLVGSAFVVGILKNQGSSDEKRPTVKSLIVSSGRTLLKSNSDQWNDRWSEYVAAKGNPLGIDGYDEKSKVTNAAPEEFKQACLEKAEERVLGVVDKLFIDISTYCIEMTTISNLIASRNKVALASSGDDAGWKESWARYIKESAENGWEVGDWDNAKGKPTEVPEDFKSKCTTKLIEKAYGVEDVKFKNVISWCTKDKTVATVGQQL
ncbi:hypothetical protein HF1_12390 [Mycoplasma haemofelis str. Langford 1]|uniref:Uncharacterized protein n=1 Tax=Mycoplasma haemofelis (strain Langford 1) TaxID=941640 RepID=E8ZJC6_MYCHL|nr:hypothetical protein [Mycoplasma haemofelis]CBY93247.1 hypothetical protein HF1_12390 [Mycoplasma haemofelis str. Langford 1]